MQAHPIAVFSREKLLGYTSAATFEEYLAEAVAGDLMRLRLAEVRIGAEEQRFLAAYPDILRWVVVVGGDDGADDDDVGGDLPDTAIVLPVLAHLARCSPRIDLRVARAQAWEGYVAALMDDPEMAAALAEEDLPLLLIFDEEWRFLEQWGPHPDGFDAYLDGWLADHPQFDVLAEDDSAAGKCAYAALLEQLTHAMRYWYNSELDRACATEVRNLLSQFQEDDDDAGDDTGDDADG